MGNVQARQLEPRSAAGRRSSILWNFRYPNASRRREDVALIVHNSRLSISEWLSLLELQQYEANLQQYATVDDVGDINDRELKRLGIRNLAHRQKMLNSLLGVRAKRRQSMNLEAMRSAPCAVPRRKSSCPMVWHMDANANDNENNGSPGAAVITTKSGKVLKQLTFDDSNTIYEELKPRSKCNSPHWAQSDANEDMENGGGHNSHASTPLAASSPNPNEQQEAIALKKALEWELSLDARELRSHAWYHGALPRQRAEEIVQRDGDFLVRDCASQPDNYVLTCRSKAQVLHFVLNKLVLQPETVYERVQYQFEEDAFDTVPDLITFYVGSGKPISAASGALIQYPCNRTYPLSFYGHKIVGNQLHTQMLAGLRGLSPLSSPMGNSNMGIFRYGDAATTAVAASPAGQSPAQLQPPPPATPSSPHCSPPRVRREVPPPRLPCKKQQRSQSLTPAQAMVVCNISNKQQEQQQQQQLQAEATNGHGMARFQTIARCNPTSDLQMQPQHLEQKFSTQSLPRPSTSAAQALRQQAAARICNMARNASLDTPDRERPPSPPPKPRKEPMAAVLAYQASGSDSGNGSGDSAPGDVSEMSLSLQRGGVIIKNPRFMTNSASNGTLKSFTEFDALAAEEQLFTLPIEEFKLCSKFDFENFSTLLLPSVENKPLDGDALNTFKMMLLETGPKLLAEHITRIDIGLFLDEPPPDEANSSYLSCSGLELLTLPHGKVFRDDIIERTQCIKLMVAVTILTCQTDLDRAELLSKWIQVAVETKTALGNLFGFCAIMLGLCMQQIQKLDQAWHILRQKYTDSAFTFEAKLRPTLSSMNEASNPQAPNTTVPHVLLYALLIDRPVLDIINHGNIDERPALYNTCIAPWETKADDFGMSINFLHLDASRGFLKNLDLFRKNAKIILEEASSRLDELLADAFRTEFHVKFLWGSSGATAKAEDRHGKLEKVLTLMADKFCSVSA